jgi:hypothetical protein
MQKQPYRERSATERTTGLNGTSKLRAISQGTGQYRSISTSTSEHRAIPQRPPSMPQHMASPPEAPRAPRPQRQTEPRKMRPWLIVLGTIGAIIAIITAVLVFLVAGAINQSAGPAKTATDFVSSLYTKNYEDTYKNLGPAVTIRLNREQFTQQAQALDQQYGKVTDYKLVEGSAKVENNIWSYTYTITREKLSKPYTLTLTLYQDANNNNNWEVGDYGPSLGPS